VYKRGSTWSYRVDGPIDPGSGRRRQVSKGGFRTKRVVEAMSRAPTEFYPVGQLSEDDVVAVLEATVSPTTDGSCDTVNAEACFRDREEAMRAPNAVSSTAHVTRSSLLPVTGNGCGSATSGKVAATVSGSVVAGVCGTIRIARCVIRPAPSPSLLDANTSNR